MSTRDELIRKIRVKAKQDAKKRRDPRFLDVMGFLVAKGFLATNLTIRLQPNKRLRIDDAVWAGENVEPRILEVLPAAVLRLGRHFDLDPTRHHPLVQVLNHLRKNEEEGGDFLGIPYAKLKAWVEFPLRDRRVKTLAQKKVVKTFRLDPAAVEILKSAAARTGRTETEVIEGLLLRK